MTRFIANVAAVGLLGLGGIWVLQWLEVLPGEMAGEVRWGAYGVIMMLAGLLTLIWNARRHVV